MLPTKLWFIWSRGFREEDFFKSTNQKQELPVSVMFVNGSRQNVKFFIGLAIDASYQVLVHLAKQFQSRYFFQIDQSETNIACRDHVC
jgi:hypothetical protein